MPPPTSWSMPSVLLVRIDLNWQKVCCQGQIATRTCIMQNVKLMQISGCWKVKVTHGDDLCIGLDEEQC